MIEISNDFLTYTGDKKYRNAIWSCKNFQIKISDIKYIVLSPRMALDDEIYFLVFIDKNFKLFKLPLIYIEESNKIESFFKIEDFEKYYTMFTDDDYYGKTDKIIYPQELVWKDLYYKDWKLFIRGLYSGIIPKSFFGNIIDYDYSC